MSDGLRLVLRGVRHAYDDLSVLEDIDLVAEPGEVMVLVGPSGCGKSTLLGIMGGLLAPGGGEVRCEGEIPDDCLNAFTYVFQDFALLPWRTVAGNIALVLEDRLPRTERIARVAEVLALTGLADFAEAWPRQLSGGMRQRVGIARALAVRPACLLMDEPLSALDAQTRGLLLDEFAALIDRARTTTIYVTHNLAEAVRLGQQVVVLSRRPGRVRTIQRIDRPVAGRVAADPDLQAIEAELWRLIRDDAAAAERDMANAENRAGREAIHSGAATRYGSGSVNNTVRSMGIMSMLSPFAILRQLRLGKESSTFERLGRSRHVADLRLIFSVTVIMMMVGVIAAVAFCYEYQIVTNWKELHEGDGVWPWVKQGFAAIVASGPFIGGIFILGGGVLAWTYQIGSARLGVVDLFACEIATLCRVCCVVELVQRYITLFEQGPQAGQAHPIDGELPDDTGASPRRSTISRCSTHR